MKERTRNLVVKVADDELEMLHRIAAANDESAAQTIRRFIRQRYTAEFGDVAPAKLARKGA